MIISASCISIRTQCYGRAAGSQTGPLRGNLAFLEIIIIFIPSEVGDIVYDTLDTVMLLMLLFLLTIVQLLYRWNDDGGSSGTGRQKWQWLMWGAVHGADVTVRYGRFFDPHTEIPHFKTTDSLSCRWQKTTCNPEKTGRQWETLMFLKTEGSANVSLSTVGRYLRSFWMFRREAWHAGFCLLPPAALKPNQDTSCNLYAVTQRSWSHILETFSHHFKMKCLFLFSECSVLFH